jgi:phage terminase large subunit
VSEWIKIHIKELLKQNRLHIHQSCTNTIYEFETYAYPDKKDLHNEEEVPIKENDHMMDAIRYVLMMDTGIQRREAQQFIPNNRRTGYSALAKNVL